MTDADGAPVTATQSMAIQANVGERWLHFLRRYLDPAGLILWAAADGTFVLSAPNVNQAPLYQIVRQGVAGGSGNVVGYEFDDDATHQHSVAVCYGRGGGRVAGRTKVKQGEVNEDLFNDPSGWYRGPDAGGDGYAQPIAFREHNVQNSAQASNFALRKLAEERREGYQLIYTVAGQQTFDDIRRRVRNDPAFRDSVNRYVQEFERLLTKIGQTDRDGTQSRVAMLSDSGKVYIMLAHASGRLG